MCFRFTDLASIHERTKAGKDVSSAMRDEVCSEEEFRLLIKSESKRARRTRQFYRMVKVYRINSRGAMVRMDSDLAKKVISAIVQTVRETDHVGWCLQGYILGVILTTLDKPSLARLSGSVLSSLRKALQAKLGEDLGGCVSIQMSEGPEEEVVDSLGKALAWE